MQNWLVIRRDLKQGHPQLGKAQQDVPVVFIEPFVLKQIRQIGAFARVALGGSGQISQHGQHLRTGVLVLDHGRFKHRCAERLQFVGVERAEQLFHHWTIGASTRSGRRPKGVATGRQLPRFEHLALQSFQPQVARNQAVVKKPRQFVPGKTVAKLCQCVGTVREFRLFAQHVRDQ